jgi:hypothetical protein
VKCCTFYFISLAVDVEMLTQLTKVGFSVGRHPEPLVGTGGGGGRSRPTDRVEDVGLDLRLGVVQAIVCVVDELLLHFVLDGHRDLRGMVVDSQLRTLFPEQ